MPASPSFFQGVTIAKFRPHLRYTVAKNGSTAAVLGWIGSLYIFSSCIFSNYVRFSLHNLLSHLPLFLSNPVGLSLFSRILQAQISVCSLFAAKRDFSLWCCVSSQGCCFSLSVLGGSNCLWPEAAVECRFIFSSHPSSSLPLSPSVA